MIDTVAPFAARQAARCWPPSCSPVGRGGHAYRAHRDDSSQRALRSMASREVLAAVVLPEHRSSPRPPPGPPELDFNAKIQPPLFSSFFHDFFFHISSIDFLKYSMVHTSSDSCFIFFNDTFPQFFLVWIYLILLCSLKSHVDLV
jgi:hypothetical protein